MGLTNRTGANCLAKEADKVGQCMKSKERKGRRGEGREIGTVEPTGPEGGVREEGVAKQNSESSLLAPPQTKRSDYYFYFFTS